MTHLWHDIEVGKNAPKIVNVVVEIPMGNNVKYELDKVTGLLRLDRHLHSAVYYPGDYGMIPKTYFDDGDPLDVFVFTNQPTYPLTLCEVRIIGVMRMNDSGEKDDKLLGVHANDPRFAEWKNSKDIPPHLIKELKEFLETYKNLEGKRVRVPKIFGATEAHNTVKKAMKHYEKKFVV